MSGTSELKRTPLNEVHRQCNARMVDFGGWDMPVQYSGIVEEHQAVRNAVGLFDVSHMGEIEIRGPEALNLVDYVTTNAASRLAAGQVQYAGLLYDHGGFVDDIKSKIEAAADKIKSGEIVVPSDPKKVK